MKHMTRTDRIMDEEIGDYPDLDMGCKCDWHSRMVGDGCHICNPKKAIEYGGNTIPAHKQAMYDCVKWYLNMLALPPQGQPITINKSCISPRHGVAYVSVNKTNKGAK